MRAGGLASKCLIASRRRCTSCGHDPEGLFTSPPFLKDRDKLCYDELVFCSAHSGLDLDQCRQVDHANLDSFVVHHFAMWQEFLVALPGPELAKWIERAKSGREIDLTSAAQLLGRRPQPALHQIVPMERVQLIQDIQQPGDIFRVSLVHDVEIERAQSGAVELSGGTPNDDESDPGPVERRNQRSGVSFLSMCHAGTCGAREGFWSRLAISRAALSRETIESGSDRPRGPTATAPDQGQARLGRGDRGPPSPRSLP
jgi:hypothetical protein